MVIRMNTKEIASKINRKNVMDVLALNEISGNDSVICKFSYAGGISGYSFGRSQFDVKHNPEASKFLREKCNFTSEEIDRLLSLDKNIKDLELKLKNHKKEIDEFDQKHVDEMIDYVASLDGLPDMTPKIFVHLVDYHNQFSLSKNGKMHQWLQTLQSLNSDDILNFKLGLKWGKENPLDVKRRWKNIESKWTD